MTRALSFLRSLLRPPTVAGPSSAPRERLRPTRRQARAGVLAGIAFVVLAHLGLNVALDTIKPEWRDPEYGHRLKRLRPQAEAAGSRPVVVVLGSSRVQMGFSPQHLGLNEGPDAPVVYNFSQAGCGPIGEMLNLQRLLAAGVKPDYPLVEVLPPVLGGDGPAEKQLIPARLGYADLVRVQPYSDDPGELRRQWLQVRVAPFYSLRLYLLSHLYGGLLPWQARQDFMWKQMQPDGWLPYFFASSQITPQKRAEGLAKAHGQYVGYLANFRLAPRPDRVYRDLIALARQHGIRVAFLIMPESPTFRSWYPPAARQQIDTYLTRLSQEEGVPVYDASAWLNEETLFADGHHLLRSGAVAFSERFGRECLGPWLTRE